MPKKGEIPPWLKSRKKVGRAYKGKGKDVKRTAKRAAEAWPKSVFEAGAGLELHRAGNIIIPMSKKRVHHQGVQQHDLFDMQLRSAQQREDYMGFPI